MGKILSFYKRKPTTEIFLPDSNIEIVIRTPGAPEMSLIGKSMPAAPRSDNSADVDIEDALKLLAKFCAAILITVGGEVDLDNTALTDISEEIYNEWTLTDMYALSGGYNVACGIQADQQRELMNRNFQEQAKI